MHYSSSNFNEHFITGQKFALMEEKVVVSTVLRRFKVEAAHRPEDAILEVSLFIHIY